MATAELHQALTNFKNMAQALDTMNEDDALLRHRAEDAYNDMTTWFNFFIQNADMQTSKLQKVEVTELS